MLRGVDRRHLTSGQAARRLGISRYTLLRAVKRGEVAPILRTPGGYLRFLPTTIEAYARHLAPAPKGEIDAAQGARAEHTAGQGVLDAREEFLSSITHDLKNPLATIRGHAELAELRVARLTAPEAAPLARHLARVIEGTDQLARMIEELADITRLHMGAGLELDRHSTDLVALVRVVLDQYAGLTDHRVMLDTALLHLVCLVDAARLKRVVGNLVSNALKYSPEGGDVRVAVSREDGKAGPTAVIAIRDQGLGIPSADIPRIFERFARAGNVAGCIPGAGIGLASARQLIEQHGGTIDVGSVVGRGSTFTVRLPLAGS